MYFQSFFSVQSLCSLCLCGGFSGKTTHGDAENTEVAQRISRLRSPLRVCKTAAYLQSFTYLTSQATPRTWP